MSNKKYIFRKGELIYNGILSFNYKSQICILCIFLSFIRLFLSIRNDGIPKIN